MKTDIDRMVPRLGCANGAHLPETRGSTTARAAENERIARLPTKLASKARRAQKKRERAARRAEQRRTEQERGMSAHINTDSINVKHYGEPLPTETRGVIREGLAKHGEQVIRNTIHLAAPTLTRDAVTQILRHIRDDAAVNYRFRRPRIRMLATVARRVTAGELGPNEEMKDWRDSKTKALAIAVSATSTAQSDIEARFARLETMFTQAMAAIAGKPAQLPEKTATVIRIPTEREQINRVIAAASKSDEQFGARYKKLYFTISARLGLDLYGYAEKNNLPTEGDGWMLTVAERAGRISEVLAIARELFGEEAAGSRS